ncbi:MAG: hypothetical protein AB7O52_07460 [Planctomycetota bacterium]
MMGYLLAVPRVVGRATSGLLAFVCLTLIAGPEACHADDRLILRVYDVSDIVRPIRNFPGPRLGLTGLDEKPEAPTLSEEDEEHWTTDQLVDLLRRHLGLGEPGGTADLRVEKVRPGQIALVGSTEAQQQRLAQALDALRVERALAYVVSAWLLRVPSDELAGFGLPADGSKARRLVDRAQVDDRIARAAAAARVVASPRLTVAPHQTASISVLDPVVYVADYEVHELDGRTVADPVLETVQKGLVLEVKVKPIAKSAEQLLLQWSASVCDAGLPFPEVPVVIGDQTVTIQTPEVVLESSQGRSAIGANQAIAVLGLDTGPDADGLRTVLVLAVERSPLTQARKKRDS